MTEYETEHDRVLEKIRKQLKNTQEFNTELSKHLADNFLIENKTLIAWKAYFKIEIPENITFSSVVSMAGDIMKLYQVATGYRDKNSIQIAILEQTKFEKYHETYQNVRTDHERAHGKALAAKSCEVAAVLATKDMQSAIGNQNVVKDFWKGICNGLTEMRKLLEIVGYALGAESRVQKDFNVYESKEDK